MGELAAVSEPTDEGELVTSDRGRTIAELLQLSSVSAVFACRRDCVSRSPKGFCDRRFHGSERASAASRALAAREVSRGLSSLSTGVGLPRFGFLAWTAKGEGAVVGRASQLGTSRGSEKGVDGGDFGIIQSVSEGSATAHNSKRRMV